VAEEIERSLVPFRIEDQFDRVHSEAELHSRPVLLLCGDREGSRYLGSWRDTLRDSLRSEDRPTEVRILEVADLRGVPFFVKGRVKKKFPREKEAWVLLDWKGLFARTYSFQEDRLNIALFDAAGRLVHQCAVRGIDPPELDRLLRRIRQSNRTGTPVRPSP
jgi:hypothetical protein